MLNKFIASQEPQTETIIIEDDTLPKDADVDNEAHLIDDRTKEEVKKAEEDIDLYNIKNFSI